MTHRLRRHSAAPSSGRSCLRNDRSSLAAHKTMRSRSGIHLCEINRRSFLDRGETRQVNLPLGSLDNVVRIIDEAKFTAHLDTSFYRARGESRPVALPT